MQRSGCKTTGKKCRAFTLVEILVVIGIIAVLISILLPAINKARESSKRTACLANLRSLGQAMYLYAGSYKDRLPNGNPPNSIEDAGATDVLVALNRDFVRSPGTFHCPSDDDPLPLKIETADYRTWQTPVESSARVSYDFYSIWWVPENGPKLVKIRDAPLAWDLVGGKGNADGMQNHGVRGGNVVYGDGHAGWQDAQEWDGSNWPSPAAKYYR